MTSYETLIGRAILSSDPAERQRYEDAVTVKLYAGRMLQDQSDTVVIEMAGLSPAVMTGAKYESLTADPTVAARLADMVADGARILDGRVLFAKPARRWPPRRVSDPCETCGQANYPDAPCEDCPSS